MLKDFITKAVKACTDCTVTAGRLTQSILLDVEYEIANPESVFSMQEKDFDNPSGRIEHLFLGKHLEQVDTKKMERVELQTNRLALTSYKVKYDTDLYDEDIKLATMTIENDPIEEIDSLVSEDALAKGLWM